MRDNSPGPGNVYIIAHPSHPRLVKIGRAGDVPRRLGMANTFCPRRGFFLVASAPVNNPVWAEWYLHEKLADCRIANTEWFRVSQRDAKALLKRIAKVA